MSQTILTCGCGNTDQFAEDAFKLLFPDTEMPLIVHSMGIMKDKDLRMVVNALTDSKKAYAYYISWNEDGINVWDLLIGARIR